MRRRATAADRPPALRGAGVAEKLAFLGRPDSYPWPVWRVESIETHMSWLFLAGARVCKLKKPIRRNGIDCRSVRQRELACRRELRLNRRLAPEVYLGTLSLRLAEGRRLVLGAHGKKVDSLVCMRRLPAETTLEHRLLDAGVGAGDMQRIVSRLVAFWKSASACAMTPARYRRKLANAAGWALAGLRRPDYRLNQALVESVAARLRRARRLLRGPIERRALDGRIVDGHGDLRPEHVYLGRSVEIIDCIEFSRALRCQDPAYELAFLAMECDRLGHPALDAAVFEAYRELGGDDVARELLDFYKAHNALKRARIAAWHLDDPETGPRGRWVSSAHRYLRLAEGYLSG